MHIDQGLAFSWVTVLVKGMPLERLTVMPGQRFRVDLSIQDSKCGMADYQVPRWSGWPRRKVRCVQVGRCKRVRADGRLPVREWRDAN